MLRYAIQLGCIILPKTTKINEMKENLSLDFEISQDDMNDLEKIKL